MRKQNENLKTHAGSLYGEMTMKEANNHITVDNYIEELKPDTSICNICGTLITDKKAMLPCGPYHSERTGLFVCPHCYDKYVKPLIDGIAEMERTMHRKELMNEREYRY